MELYVGFAVIAWLLISIGEKLKLIVQNSREAIYTADLVKTEISEIASEVRSMAIDLDLIKGKVKMIEAVALGLERDANGDFLGSDLDLISK